MPTKTQLAPKVQPRFLFPWPRQILAESVYFKMATAPPRAQPSPPPKKRPKWDAEAESDALGNALGWQEVRDAGSANFGELSLCAMRRLETFFDCEGAENKMASGGSRPAGGMGRRGCFSDENENKRAFEGDFRARLLRE
jgi:hypothetical protein